jgi:hypothetical protein
VIGSVVEILKEWWLDDPLVFLGGMLVTLGTIGVAIILGGIIYVSLPWWGSIFLFSIVSLIAGTFILQKSGDIE